MFRLRLCFLMSRRVVVRGIMRGVLRGLVVVFLGLNHTLAAELSFRWETSIPENDNLREVLSAHQVEIRLQTFVKVNLQLKADTEFVIHQGGEPFFDARENRVYLPYSLFLELHERLVERYPEQLLVRENIFSAAVEQLIWFQFARVLVSQYALPVSGLEAYALDDFVVLMLLNLSDTPYLLDAAEEYLLVDHSSSLLQSDRFQNEIEFDKARYHMMVCTTVGKDYLHSEEILKDLAWEPERHERCQTLYWQKLKQWYASLAPYLKEDNQLLLWLSHKPSTVDDATTTNKSTPSTQEEY